MLKKFSVSNFKCFKTEMFFDLASSNGYTFNSSCIKNGVVNNCMVYGHNGCGKSNLGLAVFDIIGHLTDKHKDLWKYQNYLNANSSDDVAKFSYEFLLDGALVRYEYK
ncbi:MAG: ATP-binding protein, partial [Parabacteroides sp.]|nr:ATP-binding protein [Parabacteroides sp.]